MRQNLYNFQFEDMYTLMYTKIMQSMILKEKFTLKKKIKKKKTFVDNLLTPMSFKMSTSFFLQVKRN